jgi:hypothetical protein
MLICSKFIALFVTRDVIVVRLLKVAISGQKSLILWSALDVSEKYKKNNKNVFE